MPEDNRARLKKWLESGEARLYPLTFSQRELWETSPAPPADVSNHICCIINVRGLISPEDCVACLQRVVNRQEVLRLSFLPGKNGPVQFIRSRSEPVIRFRDVPSNTPPEKIEELALQTFYQPFDLVQGPLYRAEIIRRAPDDLLMVFAIHHAIADGWTLAFLFKTYLPLMSCNEPARRTDYLRYPPHTRHGAPRSAAPGNLPSWSHASLSGNRA